MKVKLLYFAWVRERTGIAEEEVELPSELTTMDDLLAWQRQRGEGFAAAFAESNKVLAALNQEHVGHDAPISGAREIAFFPPVTGG